MLEVQTEFTHLALFACLFVRLTHLVDCLALRLQSRATHLGVEPRFP